MTPDRPTVLPDWADGLGLQPHPEGGWYAETWRSGTELAVEVLNAAAMDDPGRGGYPGARSLATAILFVLLPGEESAWHRVRSAELWFLHRGRLELRLGGDGEVPYEDGSLDEPPAVQRHVLGLDTAAGERPQLVVPPGHWQAARPLGGAPCLVSCVVTPGFDFADFTLA